MKRSEGYRSEKLSPNRKVVIASATVTREKNAIHAFTEIDISEPRRLLKEHFEKTHEKLSFTAYIVICLAKIVKESFSKSAGELIFKRKKASIPR